MTDEQVLQEPHRTFSVSAHNQALDIFYSDNPSEQQTQSLIELAHVAHWHWMQRDDKSAQNVSVALWVLSRAYAANGFGKLALSYAENSLKTIKNEDLLPSFYGYCNEALARAYLLLGDKNKAEKHIGIAKDISEQVPNPQAKVYLIDQINRITKLNEY